MDPVNSLHSSTSVVDDQEYCTFITTHHQPPLNHHHNHINNLCNTVPFSPVTTAATTTTTTTTAKTSSTNPKKRSRASRKPPTTVLTTNTNNFRAMVQEFTGIPSPPFTSPSSLDLFGRSTSSMIMRSNSTNNFDNLTQLPSYLMQNPFNLPSTSFNQLSPLLIHPKLLTENPNNVLLNHEIGLQAELHQPQCHMTTLPGLISTTRSRDEEHVVSETWDRRDNYTGN